MERDKENQLDQSCGKWKIITKNQGGNERPKYNEIMEG
jgi:hypothetical protein